MPKKAGMQKKSSRLAWKKKRRQEYLEMKQYRYYIFCEGQQTEPNYFLGFKKLIEENPIYKDNFVLLRRKLLTNAQLKRLINKIEVDKDGNVDIYLRLIGELGLDETVLIEGNDRAEETEDKTALNRHDHT